MIIIINRLGIIGLFYAALPLFAGLWVSFLVGSIVMATKAPAADSALVARSASGRPMRAQPRGPSHAAAIVTNLFLCAGLHVASWFMWRSLVRKQTGGISTGGWNAIYGTTYLLGIAFGAVVVVMMPK